MIRLATSADYEELADVMFEAVRHGPSQYTEGQRAAWVPQRRSGDAWTDRLERQTIFVVERDSQVAGFMSLAENGYVDFAYIRLDYRGQGLFRLLFGEIVRQALKQNEQRLWVHASLNAHRAFEAIGFRVVKQEEVSIGDETLERFEMEMPL